MNKKLLVCFSIMLFSQVALSQQKTDSIAIRRNLFNEGYDRQYSTVIFQFFYLNTGKEIKIVALNINDVRLATSPQNGNGLIQVYLSDKKTYKVFVQHGMYESSQVFDINVDTKYNYVIDIYLSASKKPLH